MLRRARRRSTPANQRVRRVGIARSNVAAMRWISGAEGVARLGLTMVELRVKVKVVWAPADGAVMRRVKVTSGSATIRVRAQQAAR
jgi:hypothetical protein